MPVKPKTLLGQLLIEKKIISPEQLETALKKQKETGKLLGVILMELGFVSEETVLLPLIAGETGVEYVNLKDIQVSQEAISKIPAKFASHYKIMPLEFKNNTLTLATTKPLDIQTQDEIGTVVQGRLNPVLSSEKDILETIRKYYGVGAETIEQMMGSVQPVTRIDDTDIADIEEIESEASIGKFLNQILLEAYRDRATDIHIEPFENELQIRYRVDGILYDAKVPKNIKHFKDSINSRIKILSNLNIAEKRLPQDGRFKVRVKDMDLDFRVSFLPTPYGESVVLRLLKTSSLYSLQDLGLVKEERQILERLIEKPHGIIFVTGPTGSGKTTTLYACLSTINTLDTKIITIEDPIEYQLKGITQIQVSPKIGLSFAAGLRSILRHDPDIIMVGEVRDKETAEIAIQCALTGHLMFSTLHTNDAASGVTRLLDREVEPFLISSTVECFVAQRLIRIICPKCKELIKITPDILKEFAGIPGINPDLPIYEGKGCKDCNFTGYSGRQAIYEFLLVNEAIRQLIIERARASKIKEKAIECGMKTLRHSGWEKIYLGMTSPQEVIRVTKEEGS